MSVDYQALYRAATQTGPILSSSELLKEGRALQLLTAACEATKRSATDILFGGEKPVLLRAVRTDRNAPFLKKLLDLVPTHCSREHFESLNFANESADPFEWLVRAFSDEKKAPAREERAAIARRVLAAVDTLVGEEPSGKARLCRDQAERAAGGGGISSLPAAGGGSVSAAPSSPATAAGQARSCAPPGPAALAASNGEELRPPAAALAAAAAPADSESGGGGDGSGSSAAEEPSDAEETEDDGRDGGDGSDSDWLPDEKPAPPRSAEKGAARAGAAWAAPTPPARKGKAVAATIELSSGDEEEEDEDEDEGAPVPQTVKKRKGKSTAEEAVPPKKQRAAAKQAAERAAAAAAADNRGSDEEEDDAIPGAPVGAPAAGRATPLAPQTGGGGRSDNAAEEEAVPVKVLEKRVRGIGHQYVCRMEGGGEKPLPGKVVEERYPELLAAFKKKEGAAAAAAAAASTSEEEGEASELAPAPAVGAAGPSGYPYTFLGAEFDVAKREVALVHGGKGEHMLDTMQVVVKLLEGMLDYNEAANLRDPGLYQHRYLGLKEPRLNELFFDDVLNKDCGSLSVGKPLGDKGASRHFEAVCAAGYDVIHFREVHATEGTRAKSGPKSAADLITLLLRVEGGGSGKLLKSGAGIDALRGFLAARHRARIELAFLTELKHNSKTQPQLVEYSYANGELKDLRLPIKGLLGVKVDKPPTEAARRKKGLHPDYGFRRF